MADPSMYNAMGQGSRDDPSNPYAQQAPPQAYPAPYSPAAPPQPGAAYAPQSSNQWPAYGSPQQPGLTPGSDVAYNGQHAPMGVAGDPGMGGLASQMGGLGIAADTGARIHKKKHRHAHHDIGGGAAAP